MTTAPWCTTAKTLSATVPSPPSSPRSLPLAMSSASVWSSATVIYSSWTASITAVRVSKCCLLCHSLHVCFTYLYDHNIIKSPNGIETMSVSRSLSQMRQYLFTAVQSPACVSAVNVSSSSRLHLPGLMWFWTWKHLWYDPGRRR